jgi:hypothetical protein
MVCSEYLEMPGLILTLDQAARLFDMDREACARSLTELVEAGFLRQVGGRYARADVGFDMEDATSWDVTGIEPTPWPDTRRRTVRRKPDTMTGGTASPTGFLRGRAPATQLGANRARG